MVNQLNREHLQDLPRGLLRRWGILCDTGAVTSVASRNFADHVPLQPHYTQLALSTATNQRIHIYGYKDKLSDDIDFKTRKRFNNLQKQNIATQDLQLQEPQNEEDIEQPLGVQPPVLRTLDIIFKQLIHLKNNIHLHIRYNHHLVYINLPRAPMFKQQAAPLASSPLQGPPPKIQAAPIPHAPPAVHRPAGKRYNQPCGPPPPRPQAANLIDLPQPGEHPAALGPDLVDISVDSGILQVAVNIDQSEQQLQEDLIRQAVEFQAFYEDDLSQYTSEDIETAIASELHSLGKKNIYGEVDIDSLTAEQRRHIIKTRWVIRPRTFCTSVDAIEDTSGPLKARFIAKGYSQHVSDHIKETFAATPSSTSLRTLLLHAVLHQYQVTSCDISSAFLNTPIEEDIFVQPPPEVYQDRPQVVWKLHRALYGLRTSPKMWQEHLHATLQGIGLHQLKSDRCVWVKKNIIVLAYVDDLLIAGTSRDTTSFLAQLGHNPSASNTPQFLHLNNRFASWESASADIPMGTSPSVLNNHTTTACSRA